MTGYGRGESTSPDGSRWVVEARAVNHRFLEVLVRLPRDLGALEERVRGAVSARLQRGRVECAVVRDDPVRRSRVATVDAALAARYAAAVEEVRGTLGTAEPVPLTFLLGLPDVLRFEEARDDAEAAWLPLQSALDDAVDALVAMREVEGARLADDLSTRVSRLEALTAGIAARAPELVSAQAQRLRARVDELLRAANAVQGRVVGLDEARLAQEIALLADRADISEELTRLRSHFAQAHQLLADGAGAIGRKLEFLLQEMGREVNTIGSKTQALENVRDVLEMKSELEAIREQVQNVE
jgi:uncharacterized protein (TIGR00255 family)